MKTSEPHYFDINDVSFNVQPEGQRHYLVHVLTSDTTAEQVGTATWNATLIDYVADDNLKAHKDVELILDEIRNAYGTGQFLTH